VHEKPLSWPGEIVTADVSPSDNGGGGLDCAGRRVGYKEPKRYRTREISNTRCRKSGDVVGTEFRERGTLVVVVVGCVAWSYSANGVKAGPVNRPNAVPN